MAENMKATGDRLKAWRALQIPKTTIAVASKAFRVSHATWIDWENGTRTPSLEHALAIEERTGGTIRADEWGDGKHSTAIDSVQRVVDARRVVTP